MKAPKRIWPVFVCAGAAAGYVIFHPYTMLIYTVTHPHEGGKLLMEWQWRGLFASGFSTFQSVMLPMALSFAALGALVGLLLGIMTDRKRRLLLAEHENEKKKVAIDTLHTLMVTLSHYLLNANVVIGGKVRHCRKIESNEDVLDSLRVIETEARKIDTVVGALRKITEIKTARYAAGGTSTLIDIAKGIEEQLGSSAATKSDGS